MSLVADGPVIQVSGPVSEAASRSTRVRHQVHDPIRGTRPRARAEIECTA